MWSENDLIFQKISSEINLLQKCLLNNKKKKKNPTYFPIQIIKLVTEKDNCEKCIFFVRMCWRFMTLDTIDILY